MDDFGSYWDQTSLDPQLRGKWKRIAASPNQTREHGYPIGDISEFVELAGALELRPIVGENEPLWPVKTLTTGNHRWLVIGRKRGFLLEYQFDGGYLDFCPVDDSDMAEFIRKRYPEAPNLETSSGVGLSVKITIFDATAFALLRDYPGADNCTERTFAKFEKLR